MRSLALAGLFGTFVYVSNADDGDIGTYTLEPGGAPAASSSAPPTAPT